MEDFNTTRHTYSYFRDIYLRDSTLGRGYFERNAESWRGYRNGYESRKLMTAEGKVALEVLQVRELGQTYRSEFLKNLDFLNPGLRRLVVEMYTRGLSTRDVEDTLRDPETG
jgi:putative transposase